MFPSTESFLFEYLGPFGIYNPKNQEYQSLQYIPFRLLSNGDTRRPLAECLFAKAKYKEGGGEWGLPWTPLCGEPEFGVLNLWDLSYHRHNLDAYSPDGMLMESHETHEHWVPRHW